MVTDPLIQTAAAARLSVSESKLTLRHLNELLVLPQSLAYSICIHRICAFRGIAVFDPSKPPCLPCLRSSLHWLI
jgi:hypothetical protein